MSCSSAGNYSAGGAYHLGSLNYTWAFVVTQHDGAWGKAEQVPGTSALNTGRGAETVSVSCPPAGRCSAGGYYTDSSGRRQAFVVSQAR